MKDNRPKRPRGRPQTRKIEQINTTPEKLAKAISLVADKKLAEKRKIKNYNDR